MLVNIYCLSHFCGPGLSEWLRWAVLAHMCAIKMSFGVAWIASKESHWLLGQDLECPHNIAACFSQSEWFMRRPRKKPPWLLWSRLGSHTLSLPRYSWSHRPAMIQGKGTTHGVDARRQGSLEAILAAGYHGTWGTCVQTSHGLGQVTSFLSVSFLFYLKNGDNTYWKYLLRGKSNHGF